MDPVFSPPHPRKIRKPRIPEKSEPPEESAPSPVVLLPEPGELGDYPDGVGEAVEFVKG